MPRSRRSPELPASIVRDAQHGLRPPGRGGRIDVGSRPLALLAGPAPEHASGRSSRSTAAAPSRARSCAGSARSSATMPRPAVVGLRAEDGAARWYAVRYGEAGRRQRRRGASRDRPRRGGAARASGRGTILAGFSQGACLALEVAARTTAPLGGVIAPCGARIGQAGEWSAPARSLAGMRVLLGAAEHDKWIAPRGSRRDARVVRAGGRVRRRRQRSRRETRDHAAPADARARASFSARRRAAPRALATRSSPRRCRARFPRSRTRRACRPTASTPNS